MSKSLKRNLHPYLGSESKRPKPNMQTVFKRLNEVRGICAKDKPRPVSSLKALAARAKDRIAALDARPAPDPEVDAVAAVFLGAVDPVWPRGDEIGADLIHVWADQGGVEHACKALFRLLTLAGSDGAVSEFPLNREQLIYYPKAYTVLRAYLNTAANEYESVLELAKELWSQAGTPIKCILAYLFPDQADWTKEALELWLGPAQWQWGPPAEGYALLASLNTADEFRRIATVVSDYKTHELAVPYLVTTTARLGISSTSGLIQLLHSCPDVPRRKKIVATMACIQTSDCFQELAGWLHDKGVRGLVTEALQACPDLAIPALEFALKSGAKGKTSVQGLLELMSGSTEQESDQDWVGVPQFLLSPPWEMKKKKTTVSKLKLELFVPEEKLVWEPFDNPELEELYEPGRSREQRKFILGEVKKGDSTFLSRLLRLRDEEAPLEMFNTLPAKSWNPYCLRDEMETALLLLKRFGPSCVPGLIACSSVAPTVMFSALSRVDSPTVAGAMAEALAKRKAQRRLARNWLKRFPRSAALGLLPSALGMQGKEREHAESALFMLRDLGFDRVIQDAGAAYGKEAEKATQVLLARDGLHCFPSKIKPLPTWFGASAYPALKLKDGGSLPPSAVANVALMLSFSSPDAPYPGLHLVRKHCTLESLEEFVWSVYSAWDLAGGDPKTDWAFHSLAHFGGDQVVRKLTPLIRKWPGDGFSKRATLGLEVLAGIGTEMALMNLYSISQKIRFKSLKNKALELMDELGQDLGLSAEELGDRLVPKLDLERDGTRSLSFGARQFKVSFDHKLAPILTDESGKSLKNLPKPGSGDNPDLAKLAQQSWRGLKKDVKSIAKAQVIRLEKAMIARRRWSSSEFQEYFVGHPLIIHLVRRLVWGRYSVGGDLLECFRVAEDGSFADLQDNEFAQSEWVGIPHPLEFEGDLESWKTVWSDYELLQPFKQLDRELFKPDEPTLEVLESRYHGTVLDTFSVFGLEQTNWHRNEVESGCLTSLLWPLGSEKGILLEFDPGVYLADPSETPEISIGKFHFSGSGKHQLSVVDISEIVLSLDDAQKR